MGRYNNRGNGVAMQMQRNAAVGALRMLALMLTSTVLSGCAGNLGLPHFSAVSEPRMRKAASKSHIEHVVILIQENRSFDDLFATFPGADGTTRGKLHTGQWTTLQESNLDSTVDPNHDFTSFLTEYQNGKMNGFDLVRTGNQSSTYLYQYVDPAQVSPYWTLAKQYALADHMFQTQGSGSFTAHQDLIRGSAQINATESLIDWPSQQPWGCDAPPGTVTRLVTSSGHFVAGPGPFPCLHYLTLRDLLDGAGLSWKYYTPSEGNPGGDWNAFDAIAAVRDGPEWSTNVVSPEKQIFTDISNQALATVSWVIPDFENSDHPGDALDTGPSWIAQVVNAIGQSRYWKSTAIIIVWDDWGGLYDHVAPPRRNYGGLGFRVPMIVVSPYVKRGTISHTQYEFSSIIRFIEDNWGLGRIPMSNDRRAQSIANIFDFSLGPRRFAKLSPKYSRSFFLHQSPSNKPVDDE